MLIHVLWLIAGLVLIIGGGNYATNGAVAVADRFKLSPMLIGMTVVAFGSSTPDLVVSMISTLNGKSELAVGNILGAVIFDMLLVIGVLAAMKPIKLNKSMLWCDLPVMTLGAMILLFCSQTRVFDPHGVDGVSRVEGLLILGCFAVFMTYTIKMSQRMRMKPTPSEEAQSKPKDGQSKNESKPMAMWLAIVCIVGGLAALVFGGQWTVKAASYIAREAGMSEALIGLTIVGIGSSLPDLSTSIIASFKGQNGIAVGNIIGSCIMDILFVIGTCAVVRPLQLTGISIINFLTLAGSSLLLLLIGALDKEHTIKRGAGVVLVLLYVVFMVYLVMCQ